MSPAAHPALRSASRVEADSALARIAERVAPVALADEQTLPVIGALEDIMPWAGGLARGVTVGCAGIGATSLTLALTAAATTAGAWAVAVGIPDLGLAAAHGLGVDLRRLALVEPPPPDRWAEVVGALVGAFDLVLLGPTHRVRPGDSRRLAARARERGTTLLLASPGSTGPAGAAIRWPEAPDLQLAVTEVRWDGLGQGHGHLRARRVRIETSGRRRAARPRTADLWLLDPDGRVAVVEPEATVTPFAAPSQRAAPTRSGWSDVDLNTTRDHPERVGDQVRGADDRVQGSRGA